MGRVKKVDSKEVGLDIGLVLLKFFLKTDHLHYGLFTDGLAGDIANLKQAQENYTELLAGHIEDGVKTILDVGCGSGQFARTLLDRGYAVDCVAPGRIVPKRVRELVGDESEIFSSRFQDLETDKRYDLILFSESFQYLPMNESVPGALALLNPGGCLMISDFFKTHAPGECLMGGGHSFPEWEQEQTRHAMDLVTSRDITAETASTMDIVNAFSNELLHPIWDLVFLLAADRYPKLTRFVRWKLRKKLAKMERKHFSGMRTGEQFAIHKKYMFYLFRKRA